MARRCGLSAQFLALAGKRTATAPLTIGHRVVGVSLLLTGEVADGRAHLDRAIALYNPVEHRPLTTRLSQEAGVAILSLRSLAMWLLGYPDAAKTDVERALSDAREIGHAATLLFALVMTAITQMLIRDNSAVRIQGQEAVALADEKGHCSGGRPE